MKKSTLAVALLVATFIGPALAEKDTRTPVEAYNGEVQFALVMCPMKLEIASMGNESEDGNWQGCIADAKKKIKIGYDAAMKSIKKTAARSALKEHYITASSAVSSMEPESGESRMSYKMRQAQNKNRVNERWARFELEN